MQECPMNIEIECSLPFPLSGGGASGAQRRKTGLFSVAMLLFVLPAWGASVSENPNLFGHVNQNDPALAGVCAAGGVSYACGPTAAVNSFVFLENMYPGLYDNTLTGNPAVMQNLFNTVTTLSGNNFMMCAAGTGGTLLTNFITGKQNYIEQLTPGRTTYTSQLNPGFGFILPELQKGEDVELLLGLYHANGN